MCFLISFKKKAVISEPWLSSELARRESGKKQVDIAQIKEVQRILLDILAEQWDRNPKGVVSLIKNHRK